VVNFAVLSLKADRAITRKQVIDHVMERHPEAFRRRRPDWAKTTTDKGWVKMNGEQRKKALEIRKQKVAIAKAYLRKGYQKVYF